MSKVVEAKRLRLVLGEVQLKNEQLHKLHLQQGRKLEGLRDAAHELLRELDQFFGEENRTIWDVKTAMALVRAVLQ